ncbi:Cortactin-binding protein 2 [Nymphaea thermarum]|nr:Cortactin-binding protein 2 [Nymphaea thermarum]
MENEGEKLCAAVRDGDHSRVEQLVRGGADVSYFDGSGFTPLMHAAENGHASIVKLLLEYGAPWNALNPSDQSAGDLAMESGHQEAFDLLLNAGRDSSRAGAWDDSKEEEKRGRRGW